MSHHQQTKILVCLSVSLLFLLPLVSAQPGPRQTALQAFEAIRVASDSGADVSDMISQYNSLLQQNANDSSYNALGQLASNAQASALAQTSLSNTLRLVLVPVIAFLLTIATWAVFEVSNRLEKMRTLDMEIRPE